MSHIILPVVLVAACACIAFGVVQLYSRILDYRDARSLASFRERLLVEHARAALEANEAQRRG